MHQNQIGKMRNLKNSSENSYPTRPKSLHNQFNTSILQKAKLLIILLGLVCFNAIANTGNPASASTNEGDMISSFTGKVDGCLIKLNWGTKHEIGNDYFEIERSIDGKKFFSIGKVAGSGNSITPVNYQYSDENIYKSDYFYRLKLVDFNGEYDYSNIIQIETGCKREGVTIDNVNIGESKWISVQVYTDRDIQGAQLVITDKNEKPLKQMQTEIKPGMNMVLLDASDLADGSYYIKIKNNDADITSAIFEKN